jgi:type I restriction-modification system DNA methylase subunit
MPIFQNSVLSKYLKGQDKTLVAKRWNDYKNHFHNATIQENIRNSKEEQYQGEFLIDLFVAILGYTKTPQPNFNLTTEYKNVKDSKKTDGAILIDDKVRAVIELKGTNTTDLGKIETQAFGYKNNQPDCIYIITSNFEKLRFYIDNAIEHLEFNLFTLSEKEFELLHLCLAYENLSKGIAKSIKEESVSQEDVITKKLYKDYSLFKRELYHNLVALNPQYEPIELFKKSQKLLDRFLFIFFAEDRNLLPTNLIFRINKEWQNLRLMRIEVSLYDRYKVYFNDLNNGAKVVLPAFSETASKQVEEHQIFAYNGGLFKADEILDNIKIDDSLLFKHTENLSNYDFASEVDVNILGHIFENSLNELDEIKAQFEGTEVEKATTKRKKDGVFYTPKYITKYIVDNTIGKLCTDKKAELKIIEEDFVFIKTIKTKLKRGEKGFPNEKKEGLADKLILYRNWLLEITICDPACGSGAFLNQALDFLINEHRYIDELQAKLFGDAMVLSDVEKSILENNLFGVDLNEESVEIAKLSLWLRTAQPNRKLNDLSDNIKCGNSLIDDVAIAGEKAFDWQTEFPKIFEKGGFDVIIGNPPYVGRSSSVNEIEKNYIRNNYKAYEGKFELYQLFIEKSLSLVKEKNAFISLITPQTWVSIIQATKLRKLVLLDQELSEIVFLGKDVFEDASVDSIVFIIHKGFNYPFISYYESQSILNKNSINNKINYSNIDSNSFIIPINSNMESLSLISKISLNTIKIEEIGDWSDGVKIVGAAKDFAFQKTKVDESFYPMVVGKDIEKYSLSWSGYYCCRDKSKIEQYNATDIRLRDEKMFIRNKILVRKTGNEIIATVDLQNNYYEQSLFSFGLKSNDFDIYFIIAVLNSKMSKYLLKDNAFSKKETFPQIRLHWLKEFPIKQIPLIKQTLFVEKVNLILSLNKELNQESQKFQRTIQRKFELESLPKKLQDWYLLSYGDFIKELGKLKIKLTLSQEAEWEDYFTTEATKVNTIKTQIDTTDKEIDAMVYELYGLTKEEIEIVEKS